MSFTPMLSSRAHSGSGFEQNTEAQILLTMVLLVRIMGAAPALAGVAVTLVIAPLSSLINRKQHVIRQELSASSDARLKLVGQVLAGIKTVKCAHARALCASAWLAYLCAVQHKPAAQVGLSKRALSALHAPLRQVFLSLPCHEQHSYCI